MFQLDDNLLQQLGLGSLPADEKNKMLAHIYETLELRVGMRLADQMTDAQLDEFEGFIDRNDEEGALHWLETNFPDYKQVVADELEKLKSEIKAQAPQIVAATVQNNGPGPGAMPPPGDPISPPPAQPMPQDNNYPQTPPAPQF